MVFAPPTAYIETGVSVHAGPDAAPHDAGEPERPASPVNPIVSQMAEAVAEALVARLAPTLERIAAGLQRRPPPSALPPILLSADAARLYCGGLVKSTWSQSDARGIIPAPVRVGGRIFWRRADLDLWAAHDCPGRARFNAIRAAGEMPVAKTRALN